MLFSFYSPIYIYKLFKVIISLFNIPNLAIKYNRDKTWVKVKNKVKVEDKVKNKV
jgi:hypothetical protein